MSGVKVERAEAPLASFYVGPLPWMKYAACKDMPTEMFFDDIESARGDDKRKAERKARAVCQLCPVRRDCAEQVMKEEGSAASGRHGYRGCLSPAQRRKVYRTGGLKGRDPKRIPLS